MSAHFRKAAASDATSILEMVRAHAAFERGTASLSLDDLKAILSTDSLPTHLLVADMGNALVGYAAVTFDFSLWRGRTYGHLDCLFVAASARGRGIGKQLLDAAMQIAQTEGVDRLEWQTPVWNSDAIRFYLQTGALGITKQRFVMALRE